MNGHVILQNQSSTENRKNTNFFEKQNWFGAVHPNLQIDAKLDYMMSRVLLDMDRKSLSINEKHCDLDRHLIQTAFILLIQKFPLVGYIGTGQRNTFAKLKISKIISIFNCKTVSSPLYVLENQCFERIPIHYQKNFNS